MISLKTFKRYTTCLISNKYIKIGLCLHSISFMAGLIIGLNFVFTEYHYFDFPAFYRSGNLIFSDLNNLYNLSSYPGVYFRYLPFSALLYSFLSLFPIEIAFVLNAIFKLIINLLVVILMTYLYEHFYSKNGSLDKYFYSLLFAYLVFGAHVIDYVQGQPNPYLAFLLLITLYFFESSKRKPKKRFLYNLMGGLCLGIASSFKLTLFIILPFVLIYSLQNSDLKINISRLLGVFLIIIINGFFFLIQPKILSDFFILNLEGGFSYLECSFSISITRMVINSFGFFEIHISPMLIMIIFLVPFFLLVFNQYLKNYNKNKLLPELFSLALFIPILVYIDVWSYQYIISFPFILLSMGRLNENLYTFEDFHPQIYNNAKLNLDQTKKIVNLMDIYIWDLLPAFFFFILQIPALNIFYTVFSLILFVRFYNFYKHKFYYDFNDL
ncbi:MAG: membrane protein of unknown function [Promethearchaeota archaeon]|nr:MAG: membrane protein of unknown function [Candidatus Lokiarchaeota archaeon]